MQGSEVTLHPGDKSLLSFVSEQGSKEGDTQRSRTHCPEIHTLLSLLGILQSEFCKVTRSLLSFGEGRTAKAPISRRGCRAASLCLRSHLQ